MSAYSSTSGRGCGHIYGLGLHQVGSSSISKSVNAPAGLSAYSSTFGRCSDAKQAYFCFVSVRMQQIAINHEGAGCTVKTKGSTMPMQHSLEVCEGFLVVEESTLRRQRAHREKHEAHLLFWWPGGSH